MPRFYPLKTHVTFIYYAAFFIPSRYIKRTVFLHLEKSVIGYFFRPFGENHRSGIGVYHHCVFYMRIGRDFTWRLRAMAALVREKIPDYAAMYLIFAEAHNFIIIGIEVRRILVTTQPSCFVWFAGILPFFTRNLAPPARRASSIYKNVFDMFSSRMYVTGGLFIRRFHLKPIPSLCRLS